MEDQRENDMNAILLCLRGSKKYQLEVEVIYTAMKELRENPNLSIEDAIHVGYAVIKIVEERELYYKELKEAGEISE